MVRLRILKLLLAVAVAAMVASCGGSDNSAGSTTVAGKIVGFGSIYLDNGNRYDSSSIDSCELDDVQVSGNCQDSLSVGQYVSFSVDDKGKIKSLRYDDDIEGPATGVVVTDGDFEFSVFGVSVITTATTQWKDFPSAPTIAADLEGVNVEISGEWINSSLQANYIEKQSDSDSSYEAKGTVGNVSGSTFDLTLKDGAVLSIDASSTGYIPLEGDYVEVKGTFDGTTFTASRIQPEDSDDFDHDGESEITGILNCDSVLTECTIRDTTVDISNAASCESLIGSRVEAKGSYDQTGNILVAAYCEDEDEKDELEVKCDITSIDVPDLLQPKVGTVVCGFSHTSATVSVKFLASPSIAMFSHDASSTPADLTHLLEGDCVKIKAGSDGAGGYIAGYLESEGSGSCSNYKLEGPVDNVSATDISVLGITFQHDSSTKFDYGDINSITAGDRVKIKDDNSDGILSLISLGH